MTKALMQKTSLSRLFRLSRQTIASNPHTSTPTIFRTTFFSPCRSLAQVQTHHEGLPAVWFTSSSPPRRTPEECGYKSDAPPPDERTLKLGRTLRTLQSRLPTLLASPLPQEILSPHISLHLFPSTHPHLPTVSGRVAYHAALWTAPVAWGRVPIVGNVRLTILSERVVKNFTSPFSSSSSSSSTIGSEKLLVRWKTCGKTTRGKDKGDGALSSRGSGQVDKITEWLGGDAHYDDEEFCGLFIFEFDDEGRIVTHTIEHVEEGRGWEGKASRVVTVTDWLLGRAKGKREEEGAVPGLAWGCCGGEEDEDRRVRRR
ncbi:hypothetical protein MMC14_000011 [Varicellaria rhodocarpa]|nr:hypothetical protein [Varicellaria rhodocarpa]